MEEIEWVMGSISEATTVYLVFNMNKGKKNGNFKE
jgi:hypothetical protein